MRRGLDVDAEVAALGDLTRDELVERWSKAYGVLPPKGVRQNLLVLAAAWYLQTRRLGGPSAETRRLLKVAVAKVAAEFEARSRRPASVGGGEGRAGQGSKLRLLRSLPTTTPLS